MQTIGHLILPSGLPVIGETNGSKVIWYGLPAHSSGPPSPEKREKMVAGLRLYHRKKKQRTRAEHAARILAERSKREQGRS